MNILIKLTCLVGLAIAPILGEIYGAGHAAEHKEEAPKTEEAKPTGQSVQPSDDALTYRMK